MADCCKCGSYDNPIVEGPSFTESPNEVQVHRKCADCGHVQIEYYQLTLVDIDEMEDD